jgi:anaerobic selenocysteine-containing dehydrogenase
MQVVKTVCGMCGGDNCGIDVFLENGRIVDIKGMREFPTNRGKLCPQARAAIELTYDPHRLQYPMRRDGDRWRRISWDEALDTIAAKLVAIKEKHGAQALAVYQGRALLQFIRDGWVQRFMNLYGTPNLVRNEHMCAVPNALGERLTYGMSTLYYGFDWQAVECVLLWGSNPVTSHLPTMWSEMVKAQRRGAKLIVIDPQRTRPAEQADLHASLRPGTDLALALGLAHIIIADGLYDSDFVSAWASGFDALAERVRTYTPERVANITEVPADQIRRIARIYAGHKPAFLDAGNALEHHTNSGQTARAVMILRALTGNLDIPGGHLFPQAVPLADLTLRAMRPSGTRALTDEKHPYLSNTAGFVPGDSLVTSLLEGKPYPLRAMIAGGGNPMATWPNTNVMQEALRRLDFLVVSDLYMTPTAQMAHIVLPVADPFERTQLVVRSGYFGRDRPPSYLMLRKKIKDFGECRSDWWFWRNLAHRIGYGTYFPWSSEEEGIDDQLEPLGITTQDLMDNPSGMFFGDRIRYRKYEKGGFHTPTGKVELYSHVLDAYGHDPLPEFVEPAESPVSTPELAQRYPFVLNGGRRVAVYTHSRHRNLPSLRAKEPHPLAELHPETAASAGVQDGDWIAVETVRGSVEIQARVTEAIHPGVVAMLHGWEDANVNLLTDHAHCDPIVASPPLRASLCAVRRLSGGPAQTQL